MCVYLSVYVYIDFYYRQPETSNLITSNKNSTKDFFKNIREKINKKNQSEDKIQCEKCLDFGRILKEKCQETEKLRSDLDVRESALENMETKYREYKAKYKKVKHELKDLKRVEPEDSIKFGSKIIQKSKLSLCRMTDFSKYVGDLLDICFGRDTLSESVLKGPVNRSNKTQVLDGDIISDIIMHVMQTFNNLSVGKVRGAIRQKLNTCHKSKQKMKNVNK